MPQRELFSDWPFEPEVESLQPQLAERNHLRVVPAPPRLLGIYEAGGKVRVLDPLPPEWLERRDLVSALQALCEDFCEPDVAEAREASLQRLGEFALAQGLALLREGGPFEPFLLTDGPSGYGLEHFSGRTLEEVRRAAQARAGALPEPVSAYAFVYDGLLPHEGRWTDALFVEVAERGGGEGRRLAQPVRLTPTVASLGPPVCVGPCESWG
ncbi:MAG TPA: hypothetical protein VFO83_01330 [Aggregicoccus sp.]|nr:hypothetical protein [Aggregicoccus sp.]